MSTVIKVENLSKIYDLGLIGTGTLSKDLNRTWAKLIGKPDPYASIAEINDRTVKSSNKTVSVLKDISFELNQGDVLGIIGKNGAGKSTLLKILSQITSPSYGNIKIKGRVASLLEVGTGMHPEMTAKQNIYLNGSIMGMRRHEITSKLDEIVDFAGIGKYVDTPIKRFSSGMQVRLGFAVAAFLEPEILIVDEVLAVGDAEFQKKAIGKMQDVSKGEGRTVLFVSHNMASIKALCTKGLLLQNGTLKSQGDIGSIVEEYNNIFYSEELEVDLLKRKDRKGSGDLIFSKINFFDKNLNPASNLKNGEKSIIELEFVPKVDDIKAIYFWIQIRKDQEILTTIHTELNQYSFTLNEKRKVRCVIDKLPFFDGKYSISIFCQANGIFSDFIEDVTVFDIVNGEFYKSGTLPRERNGILLDHSWELV
jgi:lipopolysaccharide transport system ATP-binding protein